MDHEVVGERLVWSLWRCPQEYGGQAEEIIENQVVQQRQSQSRI